jgi:hypothetical protein
MMHPFHSCKATRDWGLRLRDPHSRQQAGRDSSSEAWRWRSKVHPVFRVQAECRFSTSCSMNSKTRLSFSASSQHWPIVFFCSIVRFTDSYCLAKDVHALCRIANRARKRGTLSLLMIDSIDPTPVMCAGTLGRDRRTFSDPTLHASFLPLPR